MEPLPTSSLEAGTQTCPEGSPLSTEPLPTGLAHPQPQPLEPLPMVPLPTPSHSSQEHL